MTRSSVLRVTVASLLAVAFFPGLARAESLKVGDSAPELKVKKWVKGEPVARFKPGMIYVVEFWATWCPPCRESIPHVNELQKKFEGKAVMIGVNCWEDNDSLVPQFVKEQGERMEYRVATDDKSQSPKGFMAENWMGAAGLTGIPSAFVVDGNGKIAWIGHPWENMESAIEKAISETYNPNAETEAAEKRTAELAKQVTRAIGAKDEAGAIKLIDDAIAADETMKGPATLLKCRTLMKLRKYDDAYALVDTLVETSSKEFKALSELAWSVLTDTTITKRDFKAARKLADTAVTASESKNAAVLNIAARAAYCDGDFNRAVELETLAIENADAAHKPGYQEWLNRYKAAKSKSAAAR